MRWMLNCAFVATVAVLAAAKDTDPRPKRDLSLITDLISGKVFQDPPPIPQENVKVYKVEGLKGVVVKAVLRDKDKVQKEELPQTNSKEILFVNDPRIAAVSSFLGTKSLNETLVALENIKRLLESGVLNSQEEIRKVVPPCLFESTAQVPEIHDYSVVPLPTTIPTVSLPVKVNPTECSCEPKNPVSSEKTNVDGTEIKVHVPLQPGGSDVLSVKPTVAVISQVQVEQPKVPLNPYHEVNVDSIITSYEQTENKKHGGSGVVVQQVGEPSTLSPFFASRIEDAGRRAYKTVSDIIRNNPQLHSSEHPFTFHHDVHNNPSGVDYVKVPSQYSYTSVNKDGSQTTYTSSGLSSQKVEYSSGSSFVSSNNKVNNVVFKEEKPQPIPDFTADRIQNVTATANRVKFPTDNPPVKSIILQQVHINQRPKEDDKVTVGGQVAGNAGFSNIPSGYSYTTIHKDGSLTTYSDSGSFKQQNVVNVAGVKPPTPLPSFIANRAEYLKPAAVEIKIPRPIIQQEYVTPIPIYGTVHPVHSPVNEVKVGIDGHISSHNGPHQYSYTTIHKNGSKTTYSGSGLANENSQTHFLKEVDNIYGNYHGSAYYDDHSRIHVNPNPAVSGFLQESESENRYEQSHIKKPKTATVVPIFIENNNDQTVETQKVLFPKPIVSQYSYKQINSNIPNKFVVVKVGNSPNYDGFIKLNTHNVGHNVAHNVEHNVEHNDEHSFEQHVVHNVVQNVNVTPDYVYIPPDIEQSVLKELIENRFTQIKSDLSSGSKNDNSNFKIGSTKDEGHQSSTSDNSLNANPIVVLPIEPTFPDTQEKIDDSSVNKHRDDVSTETNIHRGDIPDTVV